MKNIAVIFGGQSIEHDVSIITGIMTANALSEKYKSIPIYIDRDGKWYSGEILKDISFYKDINYSKIKRVQLKFGDNILYEEKGKKLKAICPILGAINCLHGERGEDGSLEGIIKSSNIAFCSPNILASSVCMDKAFTKIFLKGILVRRLKGITVKSKEQIKEVLNVLEYPLIVKPSGGSSIGISRAENIEQLNDGIDLALRYGNSCIVEPFIKDLMEINCAVFGGKNGEVFVSECEKPKKKDKILTFEDKYEKGEREFPARIEKRLAYEIKKTAEKIYRALDTVGVIRIDFMVIGGKVYVNEINTVPGSMAYYLFCDDIGEFRVMLDEIIESGLKRFILDNSKIKQYKSTILSGFGAKGEKHL